MNDDTTFPIIKTLVDQCDGSSNTNIYKEIIRNTIKKILPKNLLSPAKDEDLMQDQQKEFQELLPLMITLSRPQNSNKLFFFSLSKSRPNYFKFFFEMITHWLIPGKRLNASMINAIDFTLPQLSEEKLTLCEVGIEIENEEQFAALERNLPIIETEISLGMQSNYHARRILEIKGMTSDSKIAQIQEYISSIINRLPKIFDYDLLSELQHVMVICTDEFKAIRSSHHLSRIISVHYLFRKSTHESVKKQPEKRHLSLKLMRTKLHLKEGEKSVLGILVGINFLKNKEVFEEKHLMSAIQNYLPSAKIVENSFFSNKRGNEAICTLYMEIEKKDGADFTPEEIFILRKELPSDLQDRIEHLMHPIFMPRNEEEILRNVLALSNQIKYLHDVPQVIIIFDKQSHSDLYFTIILVSINKPDSLSIQELFLQKNKFFEYFLERSKIIGFLRKKYSKEATIIEVKLPKHPFLRRDQSIDLNKARQSIILELTEILGEIRDFNGGMITKQNELLCSLRERLDQNVSIKYNELLLENFFYSLNPDIMRTILDPEILKKLFILLLSSIDDGFFNGSSYTLKLQKESKYVLAVIKSEERNLKNQLNLSLKKFDNSTHKLATSYSLIYDIAYTGYIYVCDKPDQQHFFCQTLENTLIHLETRQTRSEKTPNNREKTRKSIR